MMRPCPICRANIHTEFSRLHHYHLVSGEQQDILACYEDGMIFADTHGQPVDYSTDPIYGIKGAIGSGSSEFDRQRLSNTAHTIVEQLRLPTTASILDVGCAQAGLLDCLRDEFHYSNLTGFDLNPLCMEEVLRRGHRTIDHELHLRYDLIILSHVLEHILEPIPFLRNLLDKLRPGGAIYIEVPDANRYHEYPAIPFLDFNSEHINHYSSNTLELALEKSGLSGYADEKVIQLTNGSHYPALWTIARRPIATENMLRYINQSRRSLAIAEAELLAHLDGYPDVAIWGAGEYLCHILPMLSTKHIAQIVDRNPALHGRLIAGCRVQDPQELHADYPVVIAAVVAEQSIRRDAESRRIPNPIFSIKLPGRE